MNTPSPQDLRHCTQLLRAIVSDRTLVDALPPDEKIAFLRAAGEVSRPTRNELTILNRSRRKVRKREQLSADRSARATTEIRSARLTHVYVPPERRDEAARKGEVRFLRLARACYICKREFKRLHFFYDALCPSCADFNYEKRYEAADLTGRVALITGSRLKIGYQAAIKMLRSGATVIATTRFPHDSAERYSREPDFDEWKDRLHIQGLDLRHSPSVEIFARYITSTFDRLDFLINNAAQTVRRPPGFYAHLAERESLPREMLDPQARPLLARNEACKKALDSRTPAHVNGSKGLVAWEGGIPGIGLREPARLSQLPYSFENQTADSELFPQGRLDADLQQTDLRTVNSWRLTLADVPTPEMLELQLVNSVAPFILCSKLKPLMLRDRTGDKHIVNVSAMEGSFSRHTKTDKHPHTNMAKAALNMMTLTSAPDYARDGIYMNAVDTGWVTDEDPAQYADRKREELDFQPPLDIVDGAARICDPFISGLLTGVHVSGMFLKDYKKTDW